MNGPEIAIVSVIALALVGIVEYMAASHYISEMQGDKSTCQVLAWTRKAKRWNIFLTAFD